MANKTTTGWTWLVHVLVRCGAFGDWLLHKLGWIQFINQTFTRPHNKCCPGPDVRYDPRPQGHVRRCVACGSAVELHFAFWETDDGYVPREVIEWLAAEIKGIQQ